MIESFVDLTYRGLSLGRRIKLTQIRPTTGYLEHPTPMPVGTPVSIAADDGVVLDAVVMHVHEQVGGSDKAPGMTVKPALATDPLVTWWKTRVTLPELDAPKRIERARPVTVRPRTHTIPQPPPQGALVDDPDPAPVARVEPDARKTTVMNAVDQELLEQLTRNPNEIEQLVRRTGEHEVVDDGKRTILMDAVDPATLGLDVTASGSMPAAGDDDEGEDEEEDKQEGNGADDDKKPKVATPGGSKRRKKRR